MVKNNISRREFLGQSVFADSKLPKEQRQAYASQPYRFKGKDPLHKGGLFGPVKIKQRK